MSIKTTPTHSIEADWRAAMAREAQSWLGVKFCHMGRDRRRGVDCVGLLVQACRAVGVEIEAPSSYPKRPTTGFAMESMKRIARRIAPEEARVGDLVHMAFAGQATHVGILTDQGVVHATAAMRRVVEHSIKNGIPGGVIVGYYRLRGEAWPA